jgi:molybdopterin/thiamine biosynthesis adenylyltransferase
LPNSLLREISRALQARGLKYVPASPKGLLRYAGVLDAKGLAIKIELDVDEQLVASPVVRILDLPAELSGRLGHIHRADKTLCYMATGTAYVDRYRAPAQILGCLDAAQQLLVQLLSGDPNEDQRHEFWAYWDGMPALTDLDEGSKDADLASVLFSPEEGRALPLIAETKKLQEYIGHGRRISDAQNDVWQIRKETPFRTGVNWPPKTLKDVYHWLIEHDPRAAQRLFEKVVQSFGRRTGTVCVVLRSEIPEIAFTIPLGSISKKGYSRPQSWAQSVLGGKLGNVEVNRLNLHLAGPVALAARNISDFPSGLPDKYIALVGCGAIGSQLAQYLVGLGVGTGRRGNLLLVDPGLVEPPNLGRHAVGFPGLFMNKAKATKGLIERHWPRVKVTVEDVRLEELDRNELFRKAHLIIDATGERAFSNYLNELWLQEKFPALLFSWIEGHGHAARSLLLADKKAGCLRCLDDKDGNARFAVVSEGLPPLQRGRGCDSFFTPYPISAAVTAAALASDAVLDWARGRHSPGLRTRLIRQGRFSKDQDLSKTSGCPACSSTKAG